MRKISKNQTYVKNENKILNSFADLLFEKKESNICVDDIIEKTKISRQSFYMHFKSIDDIYETLDKMIAAFVCDKLFDDYSKNVRKLKNWFLNIFTSLKSNDIFYKYIAKSNRMWKIAELIGERCADFYVNFFKEKNIAIYKNFVELSKLYNIAMFSFVFSLLRTKFVNDDIGNFKLLSAISAELFHLEFGQDWVKLGITNKVEYYWEEYIEDNKRKWNVTTKEIPNNIKINKSKK